MKGFSHRTLRLIVPRQVRNRLRQHQSLGANGTQSLHQLVDLKLLENTLAALSCSRRL